MRTDRHLGALLAACVLLLSVAAAAGVVLPATDRAVRAEGASTLDAKAQRGLRVYRNAGCWYCHTQEVRPLRTDAGLGEVSVPGDYADEGPAMIGVERVGPDLAHYGSRAPAAADIVALLRDPRAADKRSSMPSYRYLSDADLDALAAYLSSLR